MGRTGEGNGQPHFGSDLRTNTYLNILVMFFSHFRFLGKWVGRTGGENGQPHFGSYLRTKNDLNILVVFFSHFRFLGKWVGRTGGENANHILVVIRAPKHI